MFSIMISIPERRHVRQETLVSLGQAGVFGVQVVEQTNPQRGGQAMYQTFRKALSMAPQDIPLLFLEDDLIVASWFGVALDTALRASHPVATFYLSRSRAFYPSPVLRMIDSGTLKHGLYPVRSVKHWFGSQALLLSPQAVDMLLQYWQDDYLDSQIRTLFPVMAYLPNPIQHRAPRSAWSPHGRPHTSLTYQEAL